MQSAFGVEHGDDAVSKGVLGGTSNFFRGIAGKAERGIKGAPKPSAEQWAAPTGKAVEVPGSKGFERGQKARGWMKKNPLTTAAGTAGVAAATGYASNEGYKRRYG